MQELAVELDLWKTEGQENHVIIVTSILLKCVVFASTLKMQKRRFEIPVI